MIRSRGSKRKGKCGTSSAKNRKMVAEEQEMGQDGFGVNDFLSRLPDDCLVRVFQHFTRREIHSFKTLNKKALAISHHPGLNHIKWSGAHVQMFKTPRGYGFDLEILEAPFNKGQYPFRRGPLDLKHLKNLNAKIIRDVVFSYHYEIYKVRGGKYIESKQINTLQKPSTSTLSLGPIPDEFFTALTDIGLHHTIEKIELKFGIPFNSELFSKLGKVLKLHDTIKFTARGLAGESITEETRRSFTNFLEETKTIKTVDLKSSGSELASILNEKFLIDIGESESSLHRFLCNTKPATIYTLCFHPSESILASLLHWETLDAAHMVLSAEWIAKLCMMKMEHMDCQDIASWRISIDHPITAGILSQPIRSAAFEYKKDRNEHSIVRKRDEMTAKIYCKQETVDEAGTMMHNLDIIFFSRRYYGCTEPERHNIDYDGEDIADSL